MTSRPTKGTEARSGTDLVAWAPDRTFEGIAYRRISVADYVAHNVLVRLAASPGLTFSLDVSITRGDVWRFEISARDRVEPITKVATVQRAPWDRVVKIARAEAAKILRDREPICFDTGEVGADGTPILAFSRNGLEGSPDADALVVALIEAPRAQDRKRSAVLTDVDVVRFLAAYCDAIVNGESVRSFLDSSGYGPKTLENRKKRGVERGWFIPQGNRKPGGSITPIGNAVLNDAKRKG